MNYCRVDRKRFDRAAGQWEVTFTVLEPYDNPVLTRNVVAYIDDIDRIPGPEFEVGDWYTAEGLVRIMTKVLPGSPEFADIACRMLSATKIELPF